MMYMKTIPCVYGGRTYWTSGGKEPTKCVRVDVILVGPNPIRVCVSPGSLSDLDGLTKEKIGLYSIT